MTEEAVIADRSAPAGDLAGMTFAVKDIVDTAGVRTTYGSPLYADHVPVVTASIVTDLVRRGAVCIGKTNLNEFAYGVSGFNPTYGLTRSPISPELSAGGSSGGSAAAVGSGVVDFALGTDTSGSVRVPAACCGVIGFKTAHGSRAMDGVYPLAPTLDSIGYFTRDVPTLRRLLEIDELPEPTALRVDDADALGALPLPGAHWVLFRRQSYAQHKARSELYPEKYGRDLRRKMSIVDTMAVEDARSVMHEWRKTYALLARRVDIIRSPVFDGPPPTVAQMRDEYASDVLTTSNRLVARTAVANALGWPAVTVPTAPVATHLLARPGAEAALLAYADHLMKRT
ncbi:amidase family protein [Pseudonocardia spinosispora]|uniref:amidase family protein n=1 Tax=Pseudonocardia spinosispora TaxID=103441 RepID=UPI0003F8F1E5|nr:amidase [Pseudonocardia spinosispora]